MYMHACVSAMKSCFKRIQLHYIYNYVVATSYQLPACLLAVVHFSFLYVLILL
jgi:hypothetical protein